LEAKVNAPGFDYLIPFRLKSGIISFIAVSVKNVQKSSSARPITLEMAFKRNSDLIKHSHPWIAMYLHMGLGADVDELDEAEQTTTNTVDTTITHEWSPELKRLSIHVWNIDKEFPFLSNLSEVSHLASDYVIS
jgi:hypothetical protein